MKKAKSAAISRAAREREFLEKFGKHAQVVPPPFFKRRPEVEVAATEAAQTISSDPTNPQSNECLVCGRTLTVDDTVVKRPEGDIHGACFLGLGTDQKSPNVSVETPSKDERFSLDHTSQILAKGSVPSVEKRSFHTLKESWWWLEREALNRFSKDAYARGFEVLRRTPAISSLVSSRPWNQLSEIEKAQFSIGCREILRKVGIIKKISVTPKSIIFDATFSNSYLLTALRQEMVRPGPVASGPVFCFGPEPLPHAKDRDGKRLPDYYVKQKGKDIGPWTEGLEPGMIVLPLPKTSHDFHGNDDEVLRFFRGFIKDNPPKDFSERRSQLIQERILREGIARRLPLVNWDTLALGLVAYDFALNKIGGLNLLSQWLAETDKEKLFGSTGKKLARKLHQTKYRVQEIVQAVRELR